MKKSKDVLDRHACCQKFVLAKMTKSSLGSASAQNMSVVCNTGVLGHFAACGIFGLGSIRAIWPQKLGKKNY